jgi:hypothetical protein
MSESEEQSAPDLLEQVSKAPATLSDAQNRIHEALKVLINYGGFDGDQRHVGTRWAIVEAVKRLSGDRYQDVVEYAKRDVTEDSYGEEEREYE